MQPFTKQLPKQLSRLDVLHASLEPSVIKNDKYLVMGEALVINSY